MKRTNTILYLVVPCYNEEEVLHKSAAVLLDKLDRLIQAGTISDKSKILFINDGSVLDHIFQQSVSAHSRFSS